MHGALRPAKMTVTLAVIMSKSSNVWIELRRLGELAQDPLLLRAVAGVVLWVHGPGSKSEHDLHFQ